MNNDLTQTVQRLADIEDIKQLKARYASACDEYGTKSYVTYDEWLSLPDDEDQEEEPQLDEDSQPRKSQRLDDEIQPEGDTQSPAAAAFQMRLQSSQYGRAQKAAGTARAIPTTAN